MELRRARSLRVAALLGLVVGAAGWSQEPGAQTRPPAAAASRGAPASDAGLVMAAAERALTERRLAGLCGPFGGSVPEWARDWATRRGRNDLFDREWHAQAVRLPRPYRGAEWLAVFSMYHPVESDADHFHRLEQRNGGWIIGAEIDEREPAAEYQISHHQAELELLPAEHRLRALDRMTVRRLAGARSLMLARMNEEYAVEEVRVAGAPVEFARAGGLLAVAMPGKGAAESVVQVRYVGAVQHPGMDNIDPDGAFLFSYWYPNIARLPATGDLTVTAPAAWTVIAQGELQGREEAGGSARTRWRQTHPVCWLQVAAGAYHRTSRAAGDKTLNVYLLTEDAGRAERVLNTLEQALPYYSRTFGVYPWSHYDVVEYPIAVGALEGYTMTAMSPELFRVALTHELAHSWWGGIVPNTYTVDMWNEGFASYSERLLSESAKPEPARGLHTGDERVSRWKLPAPVPILGAGDALDHAQSMVGYRKGAAVLHMFRRTVGDDLFYRVLSRFVVDRAGKATTWRDFQSVAERVAGHEMSGFFDPWLTRNDAPRLRWSAARQTGDRLEAEIEMTNPGYHLRLPVGIDTDDRRRMEVVEVDGARTRFSRRIAGRVRRLVLDPGGDFMLEPADGGFHPWSVELRDSSQARRVTPAGHLRFSRERPGMTASRGTAG